MLKGRVKAVITLIVFLVAAIIILAVMIGILVVKQTQEANFINDKYIAQCAVSNEIKAEKEKIILEKAHIEERLNLEIERADNAEKKVAVVERCMSDMKKTEAFLRERLAELESALIEQEVKATVESDVDTSYDRLPQGFSTNLFYSEPDVFGSGSEQKKLQARCTVEFETGLKVYTDNNGVQYYCAAMSGAYGGTIGNAWRVTLRNGTQFNVVMGDFKHPNQNIAPDPMDFGDRCDSSGNQIYNYSGEPTICVLEFICDFNVMPKKIYSAGGIHILDKFGGLHTDGGNIVKMEYLGRKWVP